MNRRTKRLFVGAMWATLAVALLVVAAVVLGGCGGSAPKVPAVAPKTIAAGKSALQCHQAGLAVIFSVSTCHEARTGLDNLIRTSPECFEIFTGPRGFNLECADDPKSSLDWRDGMVCS